MRPGSIIEFVFAVWRRPAAHPETRKKIRSNVDWRGGWQREKGSHGFMTAGRGNFALRAIAIGPGNFLGNFYARTSRHSLEIPLTMLPAGSVICRGGHAVSSLTARAVTAVHGFSRTVHIYVGKPRKNLEEKGGRGWEKPGSEEWDERNRREEDEASEIRLETSNLPESPASCKYHVCLPASSPSHGSPLYPSVYVFVHVRACRYLCVCMCVRVRVCVSATPFSAAPSPPSFSSLLSPCPRLTVHPLAVPQALSHPSIRPTARLAALPTPDAAAPRHPRSRRPHERNSSPLQTTEALVTETP